MPSLSSASTTNQSPVSQTALVPISLTSPPMRKRRVASRPRPGSGRASTRWSSCRGSRTPRCTGAGRRWRPGSRPGRGPGGRGAAASTTSGLSAATAEETVTSSRGAEVGRRVPDGHPDPRRLEAIGDRRGPQIAPRHRMTHGMEDGGDRAHPRTADADDVDGAEGARVPQARRRPAVHAALRSAGPATRSTTLAPAAAASGRPSRDAARPMASSASGSARSPSRIPARRAGSHSSSASRTAAPARSRTLGVCRLMVPRRPGQRHEHGRYTGDGELGHGHRPRPADHEVRRGVDRRHPLLERHPETDQSRKVGTGGRCPSRRPSRAGRRSGRRPGPSVRPTGRPDRRRTG